MKKRIIAIILSVVLIFGAVATISGCNKDEDTGATPNESTDVNNNSEESTDESSTDEQEDVSSEKETENDTENKTDAEADVTDATPSEPTSPTDKNEPAKCKSCGKEILPDSYSGELVVGEYCDGKCDEWLGELEI